MVIAILICDVTERMRYCVKSEEFRMHFTYQKISDGDFRLRNIMNMNKTERIKYTFNIAAPGGRY